MKGFRNSSKNEKFVDKNIGRLNEGLLIKIIEINTLKRANQNKTKLLHKLHFHFNKFHLQKWLEFDLLFPYYFYLIFT